MKIWREREGVIDGGRTQREAEKQIKEARELDRAVPRVKVVQSTPKGLQHRCRYVKRKKKREKLLCHTLDIKTS